METLSALLALCEGNHHYKGPELHSIFVFCSKHEQTVEQATGLPVIWDAMMFIWHHCNDIVKYENTLHKIENNDNVKKYRSDNKLTKDTSYFIITGESWDSNLNILEKTGSVMTAHCIQYYLVFTFVICTSFSIL